MCGIAGIIDFNKPVEQIDLERMLKVIRHRGPDDSGTWLHGNVGLGHNRLSIIDLSYDGHQPMVKNSLVLVYNGEIYNYVELRQELENDHQQVFKTKTDTEVIINAYLVWGKDCVNHFRGMWAFALFDIQKQELFCSRDRFGIKPFYYWYNDGLFIFASEIKAILEMNIPRKVYLPVLADYLIYGFEDHCPETFFHGVLKLSPGHNLVLDLKKQSVFINKFYDLALATEGKITTIDDYAQCFHESIMLHLRSDVPVGTCLSGGLDSSSITILASQLYNTHSETPFTVVTAQSNDRNDEMKYAKEIVNYCHPRWVVTSPTFEDFQKNVRAFIWHQDEPTGSFSQFMQYWVMKAAREAGLKVMLDGQGGDETLLGYERYYPTVFFHWLKECQPQKAIKEFILASKYSKLSLAQLSQYTLYFLFPFIRKIYLNKRRKEINSNLLPIDNKHMYAVAKSHRNVRDLQISEITPYQLPHLLRYEDKNSMAFSIEARVPFVDHVLVEAALTLKPSDKIHNGFTKWALRKIMSGKMPDAITWRRNKIGFEAPTNTWLEQGESWMYETIRNSQLLREMGISPSMTKKDLLIKLFYIAQWEELYHVTP